MVGINAEQLHKELIAAGIEISGVSEDGRVWGPDGKTEIQKNEVIADIIAAHVPKKMKVISMEEKLAALQKQVDELEPLKDEVAELKSKQDADLSTLSKGECMLSLTHCEDSDSN